MENGYCIYFGEKPFIITNCLSPQLYALTTQGGTILINQPNAAAIKSTISDLDRTNAEAAIILTNQVALFWKLFQEQFQVITAGGGLVKNEKSEFLFIFRRGKWDLPKGKIDPGETKEAAAVREVQEETGLQQLELGMLLGETYHTYKEGKTRILKRTYWFAMRTPETTLTPQTEEDIEQAVWVELKPFLQEEDRMYGSIREVLESV